MGELLTLIVLEQADIFYRELDVESKWNQC